MSREQSYQCRFAICGAIKTIIKSENDNSNFPDLVQCGYRGCTGLAYKVIKQKDYDDLALKKQEDTFFPGPYLYQTGRSHCVSPEQMQLYMKQDLRSSKDGWIDIKELK